MQAENVEFTEMMNTALRFINSTARHIFLTGKAGTGKTTFLRNLQLRTHKQFVIVAPTGIAALNAGGTTIHSQFLFPFGMYIPDRNYAEPPDQGANWYTEAVLAKRHPLNSVRKQVLRAIDLLIIDEVSMLRADLLDAIDFRLRSVRGNFHQGFGGVQLLLIGDLYQLPPVIKRTEAATMNQYYKSGWFFDSKAIQRDGFTYIELNKIFRQKDESFISILNNLRANRPTRNDIESLNRFLQTPEEIKNTKDVITLTTHNNMADSMNLHALNELPAASTYFHATVENDYPESMYPVLARLELKPGAQIMFTRNDSESGAYYNGKLATVLSITGDTILVRMADSEIHYKLKKEIWENKKYTVNEETKDLEEQVVGSFAQYPVKLAWAITVHKSQGLTFDKAIIDVGQAFADGQVYVALSRLRSLDGLILRTKVDPAVVSADRQIVSFDEVHNRPNQLNDEIKSQQREYLLQQANKTFDFNIIPKEIAQVAKQPAHFKEGDLKPVLLQIAERITSEAGHTQRYREQLKTLLVSGKDEEFLDRVQKGSDYYSNLLWTQARLLIHHIHEQQHEKRNKGYLDELNDLDQLLFKKLEDTSKMISIAQAIIQGIEHFDFEPANNERIKKRDEIRNEASKLYETSWPKRKKKKGKKVKGQTIGISVDMAIKGLSIEEIAEQRDLAKGTIETHLVRGIESGKLQIQQAVPATDVKAIEQVIFEMAEGFSVTDLHERLNGAYSFGTLRLVMTHLDMSSKNKAVREV